MVTLPLAGRMGRTLTLPVKVPVTIDTFLNFDGDLDGHGEVTLRVNGPIKRISYYLHTKCHD